MEMRKKSPVPFEQKFPNADPLALRLLQRLLAFDPKDRPTAQEVSIYLQFRILFISFLSAKGKICVDINIYNTQDTTEKNIVVGRTIICITKASLYCTPFKVNIVTYIQVHCIES